MNKIFLDIETVPSNDQWVKDYVKNSLSPPGNIKKQESIDKWWKEKSEAVFLEKHEKCSFDGALNNIVCIGVALNQDKPQTFSVTDKITEEMMLRAFLKFLELNAYAGDTFIGHNVASFDLEVIKKRCIILGLNVPTSLRLAFKAKPWDAVIFDTMLKWDARNSASLDKICCALGIEGKEGTNGSHVWQMFKSGDYESIATYCASDVEKTRYAYERMKNVL